MLVTTESIVLRARKQGETSKIVTLYTREFGKVNVIAKGAREMKSKFGGALEMFARSSVVFYKREKHDALNLLSKAEIVDSHGGILRSLKKMEAATAVLELVLHAMHDEEENQELFELLAGTLETISGQEEDNAPSFQMRFYLEFTKLMGFEIDLDRTVGMSPKLLTQLQLLGEEPPDAQLPVHRWNDKEFDQLQSFFQSYFAEHLPGISLRSLKSSRVFGQL